MADKSFGVKQINLIGASGTPTIESPNNLNLNATTVAISTDVTIGGQVQSDLKIGSSYSVGIGSTLPTAKLDVVGDVKVSGLIATTDLTSQQLNVSGLSTFTGLIDSNGGLDVTGHTELDNLNVSGISTIGSLNVSNLFTVGKDSFSLVGVITASDGGAIDYFGESLATNSDGSSFAIGARFYDLPGYLDCGAVYIVDRSGDTFSEVGILTAGDDIQQNAYFGSNVAMSRDGSTIVASAFSYDSGIGTEGRAYVFSRSGSTFTRIGILTASDEVGDQEFGNGEISVSEDGTYIAIGNYDYFSNTGLNQVYIYEKNGGTYSEVGILTAGETRIGSEFGYSLQFTPDASTLIVGDRAFYGYVNIFERTGSNFNQVGVITAPVSVTQFDDFAESVAITPDKSTIVVGVPQEDIGGSNIGNVFIYDRVGTTNNYVGIATLASSNPEASSYFGDSVSITDDGSLIVVGARLEDNNGISNSGAAYVFRRTENTFTEVGILTSTNQNTDNYFSNPVAIAPDGSSIIVGELNGDVGGTNFGNVFVYDVDNLSNIFATVDGKLSIGNPIPTAKLDVVGHTELDTLNVSGVSTFTGLIDSNGGLDVTGHTELDTLNVSGVSTFTGLIDSNGGLDVTGHTELDNLNVSGVSTFSDTTLTNLTVQQLNVSGVSTFTNNIGADGNLSIDNFKSTLAGTVSADASVGIQSYFGINVACNSDASSVIVIGINTFSQGTISLYDKNGSDYDFIGIVTDTNTSFTATELPADCVMSDDGTIFAFSSGSTTVGAGNTIIVWQRSGSTISQLGLIEYDTLTGFGATEGISSVEFGCSLDMSADGTKFVIGAERDRLSNTGIGTTTFTGRVHVVDRSGSTFTGIATLTPDALYDISGLRFGFHSVMSDDGSTIVVSQPFGASNEGVIYKFSRVGNTVTQVGLTTTVGNFVTTGATRGRALEISGDGSRIFVGCVNGSTASVVGSLLVLDSDLNLLEQIDLSYIPGPANWTWEDRKTIQSSYDGKTIVLGSDFYDKCEIYQYSNALGRYKLLTTTSDDPNGVAISQDGLRAFIGTKSEPSYAPGDNYWIRILDTTSFLSTDANSVAVDSLGNIYMTGSDRNGSDSEILVVKFDPSGNILWQKTLDDNSATARNEYGYDIAIDSSDNVYIAGTSYNVDIPTVVKYDSSGTLQWKKWVYNINYDGAFKGIAIDSSDNLCLVGDYFRSPTRDIIIVKLNSSDGSVIWQRRLYGGSDAAQDIAIDSSDNIYISGYFGSTPLIAKYNSSGTIQWQRIISATDIYTPQTSGIVVDSSDNIYLVATLDVEKSIIIFKYDSSGAILWKRQILIPETNFQTVYRTAIDTSDNVYICGIVGSNGLIVKYNSSGVLQWQRLLDNTTSSTEIYGIAWANNNIYIAGETSADPMVAKLPSDGSLIGNHDYFSYQETSYSEFESSITDSTSTLTSTTDVGMGSIDATDLVESVKSYSSSIVYVQNNLRYYDIFEDSKLLVAGSVGIGTTNPTAKLDVVGDVKVGINTSQGVILTSENGTKYRLIVDNSGNLSTVSVT